MQRVDMRVLGIDLSGPANPGDTAAVLLRYVGRGASIEAAVSGLGDFGLMAWLDELGEPAPAFVGLDAPLSYQDGGGDRSGDHALRKRLIALGCHPGSVMPPTLTRMVYLSLRGIAVARLFEQRYPDARIAEVHPGAALRFRGASPELLRAFKREAGARQDLLAVLAAAGLPQAKELVDASDHLVAAAAAALATLDWALESPRWLWPAAAPWHPYDYIA